MIAWAQLLIVPALLVVGFVIAQRPAGAAEGLVVLPARLDVGAAAPGSTVEADLTIESVTGTLQLEALGDLADWLTVDGRTLPDTIEMISEQAATVVVAVEVPDGAAPGEVSGAIRIQATGDEGTSLGAEIPVLVSVLDAGLAPAELTATSFAVAQREGAPGFVVTADIANEGGIDAAASVTVVIEDGGTELRRYDLGRVQVDAGATVPVDDLIDIELAPGKYTARFEIAGHPQGEASTSFAAIADAAERGSVLSMRLDTEIDGAATLEVVVRHPGTRPALVEIFATADGSALVDESVVAQPGSDDRTLLFPIADQPDGTRLQVFTSWNNERIDDRALTFGASDGSLNRTLVLVGAALVIGLAGLGLVVSGRRRVEESAK